MTEKHYMDFNATAPIRPEVVQAVIGAFRSVGNPSSVHAFGRASRQLVEDARRSVARLVGTRSQDVIFTSGGTEANNLALAGSGRRRVLMTAGEHDSILQAAPDAERITLKPDGMVDLDALTHVLSAVNEPALLSIMLANNETGVIQPVPEAVAIARRYGAAVHCDAVQAAGKIPVDLAALGVDMLTLSAHKIGGPQGVGALVLAPGFEISPLLRGGGQERRRRAGTENVAGCAGFGVAAELAAEHEVTARGLSEWRDAIERRILELSPKSRIFGREAGRLPNTICVTMPDVPAETQVMALDLAGVAVSSGSACSSGKVQPSHVLRAMGASREEAASAIRVSLGWSSRAEDVEAFLDAWAALYHRRAGGTPGAPQKTSSVA
jgi:cysteine desulfurase